eukprot:CAMPEP_0179110036 /NCGR_PEP_ID=MMETSP0796-20121207/51336_1 /TAXON_ID=73915 /ORGANISM="Pyrodinium bahamense, Strain pbaha01" /LENGTH=98 /DNA_ID=CAMNT_0020808161 /DNA_START=8 /DNA_END=301 /DNA_ORIENTATION=+
MWVGVAGSTCRVADNMPLFLEVVSPSSTRQQRHGCKQRQPLGQHGKGPWPAGHIFTWVCFQMLTELVARRAMPPKPALASSSRLPLKTRFGAPTLEWF